MLIAVVKSRSFPDNPDWEVLDDDIPIGTEYEVLGFMDGLLIVNRRFGQRLIQGLLVKREGAEPGWIPIDVLELKVIDA